MNHNEALVTLPPDMLALINEPLSEPPARAREHWPALAKAMSRLDDVRVQQSRYAAEVDRLREELNTARQRDHQALAVALATSAEEPQPEAARIEAEIERNAQRAAAMNGVILEEQRRISKLVLDKQADWKKELQRHITDTAAVYRVAIVDLERARQRLIEEVQLGGWLTVFPQTGGQVLTHELPGDPDSRAAGPPFRQVADTLVRDCEQLAQRGPVRVTPEQLRQLEKRSVMLERVSPDGARHQMPFSSFPPA